MLRSTSPWPLRHGEKRLWAPWSGSVEDRLSHLLLCPCHGLVELFGGGVTFCPVSSQAPLRLTLAWNLASLHLFNLAQHSLFFANHYSSLSCQSFLLPPLHPLFPVAVLVSAQEL